MVSRQSQVDTMDTLETEARTWLEEMTGNAVPGALADELKNGVMLCNVPSLPYCSSACV